jgi:hypothetical protein
MKPRNPRIHAALQPRSVIELSTQQLRELWVVCCHNQPINITKRNTGVTSSDRLMYMRTAFGSRRVAENTARKLNDTFGVQDYHARKVL